MEHSKTIGPSICMKYFGLNLDSELLELRLPADEQDRVSRHYLYCLASKLQLLLSQYISIESQRRFKLQELTIQQVSETFMEFQIENKVSRFA